MQAKELTVWPLRSQRLKKPRGLLRRVHSVCRGDRFSPDRIAEGGWYDLAHIHLDWRGYGDYSFTIRKTLLAHYAYRFRSLASAFAGRNKLFQIWIIIHPHDSGSDALYFHTPNPHTEFPVILSGCTWGRPPQHLFRDLLPEFAVMEGRADDGIALCYFALGMGEPLCALGDAGASPECGERQEFS